MNLPAFRPFKLEDEDVVYVVVVTEALVLRGSDVGIGLNRMSELGRQPLAEFDDRWPDPVQGLEDQCRPIREETDKLVVADLVGDCGPHAARSGEGLLGERRPVLGHPQKWCPESALGNEFVDGFAIQQLSEVARQLRGSREQSLPAPVVGRETLGVDADQLSEHGVPGLTSGHPAWVTWWSQ